MSHNITINQIEGAITITDLTVKNPDFFSLIVTEPAESQVQTVLDVLAVGSTAMQRVRTTIDVDFVEKRFGTLSSVFEKALGQLEVRATDAVTRRFSPSESGSYTRQISDLIAEAKKDVQSWNKELDARANSLLDPDKKTSAVGKLVELVQQASSRFQQMFDPTVTTSYAYRLNQQLSQVFGTEGHAGLLQGALDDALKPVFRELQDLKEKIEARKAAEQVIESSTLKGKPFEDWVQGELSRLALPYQDDVELVASGSGSRAGDFLISFAGLGKSAVVEARNRKQISLPAIKSELEREVIARSADLAIYVSSGPEMLPQHVGEFQIYGNKIVVTANNLHIAYRLARVLAAIQAPDGSFDLGSLRSVLAKIKDAVRSLRNIKTKATQVENLGIAITADANGTEDTIFDLIDAAEKLLEPAKSPQSASGSSEIAQVS
jgi:hypothetical protein